MTVQNDTRWSHSPLTMCKTTEHHIQRRKHNQTLMQRRRCNGPAAFVVFFIPRSRGGDRLRHNPRSWKGSEIPPYPRFALRWRRMRSLPVQQRGTAAKHEHTNKHTVRLTMRRRPRPRCTTTRRPLPQMSRYSPLAVSEGDPASCARLCIHSVTMRAARGSSTARTRLRGGGPAASF